MQDGSSADGHKTESLWLFPTGQHVMPAALGAALPGALVTLQPRREWLTFYDTYDWELHFSGLVLLHGQGRLVLCQPGACSRHAALAAQPWKGPPPPSAAALGEGDLRREIGRVSELQALLPVARVCRLVQPAECRDMAGKVLLRLRLETFYRTRHCTEPFLTLLRLSRCPGFTEDDRTIDSRLQEAGLQEAQPLSRAAVLPHLCVLPRYEEIQPVLRRPPAAPCREAVLDLAGAMLAATRRYEDGIMAGVEVECLHRYRVLLRRTRSLLGLMKPVLPVDDMRGLRLELGRIATRTNRLRDLDVFLASLPDCEALIPAPLRPGLAGIAAEARRERGLERGRVLSMLRSRDYAARMDRLAAAFAAPDSYPATPQAEVPVGHAARQRLWKQCRAVAKAIPGISAATADADLHRLRLSVKKARYLLEIFGGFYDPDAVRLLASRCRQLQGALGAVCDLGAQQKHVLALLERRGSTPTNVLETAAVGALAGALFARQKEAREALGKRLARFLGRKPRKAIRSFRDTSAEASPCSCA